MLLAPINPLKNLPIFFLSSMKLVDDEKLLQIAVTSKQSLFAKLR